MPVDPRLIRARARFEGGARFSGAEGLENMSVSSTMSSPHTDRFRAHVTTTTIGDVPITRFRALHLVANRRRPMLDDSYSGFVQMAFVTDGVVRTEQRGAESTVRPGEIFVLTGRLPFRTLMSRPTELIQFYLPVGTMQAYGHSPDTWAGRSWPGTPSARVLRQLLETISAPSHTVPLGSEPYLGRAVGELAIAALNEADDRTRADHDLRHAYRVRARAIVVAQHSDPGFGVAELAAALGVSRRYLHDLFADEELGVGGFLRQTRLGRAAQILAARGPAQPTLTTIAHACGFRGEDQFARAFKRAYGMSPTEYAAHSAQQPAKAQRAAR